MLGLGDYDSDDEPPQGQTVDGGQVQLQVATPAVSAAAGDSPVSSTPAGSAPGIKPKAPPAEPPAESSKRVAPGGARVPEAKKAKSEKPPEKRIREIRREIVGHKSATAVVATMRREFDTDWDPRWGADALLKISKRSTARTRREWAVDKSVLALGDRLKEQVAATEKGTDGRGPLVEEGEWTLIALEGLRRMAQQEAQEQRPAVERVVGWLAKEDWRWPVKSISRLFWLAAPLKLPAEMVDAFTRELRVRAETLDGPDVALVITAMRHKGSRDPPLLKRVLESLRTEAAFHSMSASEMVELSEGLRELNAHEAAVLRPLGQEALRRRGELTPDESKRMTEAYAGMKFPLKDVWGSAGANMKNDGKQLVTTTTFVPQEGHEKKRRGNHDIEKTSPPRVVRDYKMMSY